MRGRSRRVAAFVLASLGWIAVQVLGCSSKDVRYPEDHARFVKIDRAVEQLRQAYVRKDLSDIQGLMLPREALERVAGEIRQDFQTFQEISLDWSIDRIVIEGQTIEVIVNWAGLWKRNPADAGLRERGLGVLRWMGEKSILLNGVDGDLPFGIASRQTGAPPQAGLP